MARLARLVVPGLPHHVTQRGNGRRRVFFSGDDYRRYRDLLAANCRAAGVACWAFALLPNRIHAILVPQDEDGLRAALAPTHRRYAGLINARRRLTGHFWQGRYGAAAMDEAHLLAAFRYILLNPVRAKLAETPEAWPWSSAAAYLGGAGDGLTVAGPMLDRFPDIRGLLATPEADDAPPVRPTQSIGRPLGSPAFIAALESQTHRTLTPGKRGPKPRKSN